MLAVACSINEPDLNVTNAPGEFYASIENTEAPDTKVYATEELYLRWNADDRISIFNKYTYNQEYRFAGETGDNSGSFKKVDNDDFVTGNSLENIYAIYPYLGSTRISDTGTMTVTLPAEQKYAENTFGLGANTMISATTNNQLMFKNVGGYLMLKLYGDDVTVTSITLKGNNGEKLSGAATVTMPVDGIPSVEMSDEAGEIISLICETPVKIGSSVEAATTFWLVVPPTVFSKGFTLTVKDDKNGVFEKATTKSFDISRNKLARMSALGVVVEPSDDAIVFADEKIKAKLVAAFDTNEDGELSYKEAAAVASGEDLKNALGAIKTYTSFDEFQYFINVTSIPDSFFSSWNKLSSVGIPPSVLTIGNYAFKDCINLSNINLPNSLSYLGYGVFAGCTSLISVIIPDSVSGTLGRDINLEHNNPYSFNGDGVFEGCTSLEEVTLSKHITSLGVWAFHNCSNLEKLIIPESVVRYNIGTFEGCEKLKTIPIPQSMTIIPKYLFWGCMDLCTVNIPDHCTKIGAYAFAYCQSITSLSIPESVISIGVSAFSECSSLSSIVIPESISAIESETFKNSGLISVTIPESVTSIGNQAFRGCKNLESIVIPDSITSIGNSAFSECVSLKAAVIPETVTSFGSEVFQSCSNLSSVSLPNNDICLNKTFQDCENLKEIVIPPLVELYYSFDNCTGLQNVTLLEGREKIGDVSFRGCTGIKTITIPKDVISIGALAFWGCTSLISVKCESINPPTGGSQMFPSSGEYIIYVPAESVDLYKSATKWSDYADRIQAIIPLPEAVDLGLSVKWASFNLGAIKPEEYGDYYAWGETEPKDDYSWSTYKWCNGSVYSLTKYNNSGFYGIVDNRTGLESDDDVAHTKFGGSWRMPTEAEWQELRENCTWTWTVKNEINGRIVTSNTNGASIFLPAAGYRKGISQGDVGSRGNYWSSSFNTTGTTYFAYSAFFESSIVGIEGTMRDTGLPVRPVSD